MSHQRVLDDDGTSHPSDKAHRFGPLSSSVSRENRTKRAVITTRAIRDSSSGSGGGDSSNTEGEEKGTLTKWLEGITIQNEMMIHSDQILTIVEPVTVLTQDYNEVLQER